MLNAERTAVCEVLESAHAAHKTALDRQAADWDLDPRLIAIARTKLDEALAMSLLAVMRKPVEAGE